MLSAEEIMLKNLHRAAGKIQSRFETLFATYSTRKLLEMRGEEYRYFGDDDDVEAIARFYARKKVLATRPHVPNKIEVKQKRKDLARRNRGNGKSRNR